MQLYFSGQVVRDDFRREASVREVACDISLRTRERYGVNPLVERVQLCGRHVHGPESGRRLKIKHLPRGVGAQGTATDETSNFGSTRFSDLIIT